MSKTLRLYDIPRDSKIKCDQGIITFHHLDGAYSYCTADWQPDGVCHLSASQPLEKIGKFYHLKSEEPQS